MWYSLRFRLTMVFVGLAVGPLLLVGAILAYQSFTVQQAQALHLQRQVAQRVSVQIEAFIRERESEIRAIGDMWNPTESNHEQQRHLLSGLLFHQEDVYEELTLLDGGGQEQFRVSRLGMIAADLREWPVADEFVISQARGETYYSPVWFDDVTGEPLMTIALPIFDLRTGAVGGVLVADFRFKTVWDLIADEQVSEGESVYVVDNQSRVVAHRNPSVVLGATQFDLPNQDGVHVGLSGEDTVLAVAGVQLGEQHLTIVAEKATSEAFELALSTVYVTSGVVVLTLIIASGLGVLAMRRIVQPVETLASVARSIMAGDLSQQVDVTKRDEIGDLAKTFNSMTAQLRQTLEELERRVVDLRRAEEERSHLLVQVQEQARRVQQIMDTVPEGVLLLDAGRRIVLANPVAEGDLVVLADAKVGDALTHLGDRPLVELLTSPPKGLWHEVKTGTRTFEVIARPIESGPEPEDWVLVINDVTQEREIQQHIQQQERLAAVGQLAAGIAHDFNNIMAAIVLYAQMTARADGVSTTVRERMKIINQQAEHATDLIQQILDFGRRAVLERRPMDLLPLLKEYVKLLERTLPENIGIKLDYGPDEYTVHADPTRMQQMVTNLAVNARDAMPEGGSLYIGLERIRIEEREATPLPEMEPGDWVQVTVSDTGVGIPPDVLPRIYEPFFTTRAPLGSGLGLAQVHGIVAQHEGHIDVETQLGQGTTFTIYLPALAAPQTETSTQGTAHLIKGEKQTILMVEDNAVARQALVESLKLLDYQVLEASNGQQALEIFERRASEASHDADRIALVLSDVVMPGMGGIALFHTLREKYPQVRLVLLTGHPMEDELKNLSEQGLSGWLLKPPSLAQLAEMIGQALKKV